MNEGPLIKGDAMYRLLRDGKIDVFNKERSRGTGVDLTNCDFRGVNLKGIEASGVDFSGCYFRQADLRGLDLREAKLDGASLHGARISGVYFPAELRAEEITLSLIHGTRLRVERSS